MVERRAYDTKKDYLPAEVKGELIRRKLLVERSEILEFRHDRIRSYLAAQYFSNRWRAILSDDKTVVDANWDVMLQFYLATERNGTHAKGVIFKVLNKDRDTAIRVSSWCRDNRPKLFEYWGEELAKELGKQILVKGD
jgi:hypothetical protein